MAFRDKFGLDALLAAALLAAGELEVLLGPAAGGSRAVSAAFVALATVPLAWRRSAPLLPLLALAGALPLDAALGGFLVEQTATFLAVLVVALYSAGAHAEGAIGAAVSVAAAVSLVVTRVAFDPAVDVAGDVAVTSVAVALPLLVGRWVHGQALLQLELGRKAERLAREREAHTRQAAEEERMRIASDLQAAVAGSLRTIQDQIAEVRRLLPAGQSAQARSLLSAAAGTAREALADVRRVLGILRREGQAPSLEPPAAEPRAPAPVVRPANASSEEAKARRAPLWRRIPPRRLDVALVAALIGGAELELALVVEDDRLLAALTPLPVVLPLLARRSRPLAAALAVIGGVALQSLLLDPDSVFASSTVAIILGSYSVGAHADRTRALAGLALTAAASAAHAAVFHPGAVPIALLGGVAVPWITGRLVQGQGLLTREARERSAQVERRRAQEAEAAVTAERMRVARELHDAVAHSISVIAIQAAGAEGLAERDPARAAETVELIETVARDALAELSRLVGADAGEPRPGLDRVDALAQRARDGGLPVDVRVEGRPEDLPAGVDLAAFRIVQEALANASKHAGDAHAWVVVRYAGRAVELEIADDGRGANGSHSAGSGSGHGLIGMRERAALYGGTLDTGSRPGGGFRVRARLPVGAV